MQKILIYEYITGGGLINEELYSPLLIEAKKISDFIIDEFSSSEKYHVEYFCDHRIKPNKKCKSIKITNESQLYDKRVLSRFDLILPIMPEEDFKLYSYCEFLQLNNYPTLISDYKTIGITSDKYKFFEHCLTYNIPTIQTYLENVPDSNNENIYIEKDRYGVGCSHVKKINGHSCDNNSDYLYQPFIDGEHFSTCVVFGRKDFKILTINKQNIKYDSDNNIHLSSLKVNVKFDKFLCLYEIVMRIHYSLPSLYGYVGIDFILHENNILIVEINPRLTTSFTGIPHSIGINIANRNLLMSKQIFNPKSTTINL